MKQLTLFERTKTEDSLAAESTLEARLQDYLFCKKSFSVCQAAARAFEVKGTITCLLIQELISHFSLELILRKEQRTLP